MCCSTNETFIDLSSDKLFKEQSREKAKELFLIYPLLITHFGLSLIKEKRWN